MLGGAAEGVWGRGGEVEGVDGDFMARWNCTKRRPCISVIEVIRDGRLGTRSHDPAETAGIIPRGLSLDSVEVLRDKIRKFRKNSKGELQQSMAGVAKKVNGELPLFAAVSQGEWRVGVKKTFKLKMFHNLDQLRLQLERENLHGVNAKTCLQALRTQFKEFYASKVNAIKENGSQLHDEILHEHQIKSSVKTKSQDIQIKPVEVFDNSLIVSKGSLIEPENNDAFSKPESETHMQRQEEKVQLTALHNILANEQQHTEQSEPSYDTHLLETIESNTTPTSTNMCHRGGEIDQDALLKTELLKTKDL
ncbi:hypothetical protein Tco_0087344 [Tanacetum coccineum]